MSLRLDARFRFDHKGTETHESEGLRVFEGLEEGQPPLIDQDGHLGALRTLPEDPDQSDLKTYEKVGHDLKTKIADKKLRPKKSRGLPSGTRERHQRFPGTYQIAAS